MSDFIEVTSEDGKKIMLRRSLIISVGKYGTGCRIAMVDYEDVLNVDESYPVLRTWLMGEPK